MFETKPTEDFKLFRFEALETRTLLSGGMALALIEDTLPDQTMINQSLPGVTKVYFNPQTESAATVLNAAIRASDSLGEKISDLMVLSHGRGGYLSLGNDLLSANQFNSQEWKDLSRRFSKDASIDLYSCDVAADPAGRQLLNQLHAVTGANVYGSTHLVGAGGGWNLNAHSAGAPDAAQSSIDAQSLASYPANLLITTVTAAAATPTPVTGTTAVLSVTMLDTLGTPTFTWTTTSKPTGATVSFSNNTTTTAAITTATFNKAGNYSFTVTATDGAATNSSSVSVTVNQTLTTIAVTPTTASISLNASQSFSASALDQFGNAMVSQPTFTWSRVGVGSINSAGLFTSASSIGTSVVTATSGLISGTASVTVANAAPTVATAAAASLSTITGSTVSLSILGADDGGESNLIYSWAATTKPSGSAPVFSSNGLHSSKATTVTFFTAGAYTFTGTMTDLFGATASSSVSVTVVQTLSSILVSPAAPTIHLNQTQAFTDGAMDQFGNAMTTAPTVAWSLAGSSVGSINASTGSYVSGGTPGSATIDATAAGIIGADTVSITNAAPTIANVAGASPSTVTGTTSALSVLGADDGGESNLTYTWSTTAKPAGAASPTFSINGTNAAKNTTATFSQSGTYILQATATDAFGATATSSVSVTVSQGNPNITISGTSQLNLNQTQLFTATALDQFGNPLTVQPVFTWSLAAGSVGSISALTGIYNAGGVAGNATLIATSGAYSASQAVTVADAPPTVAVAAASTPSIVTGTGSLLTVLGASDAGEPALTYTWSPTTKPAGAASPTFSINGTNASKTSTVTFSAAGSYVFQVYISDGSLSTTSSVAVTVSQTASSIAVTPATAAINETATQQFSAVVEDQFGAAMATQPAFTWSTVLGSIGSISSTGLFTAPALAGSATIAVTGNGITGNATVSITDAPPTVATAAAASPASVTGTTAALSVLGASDRGESNLSYTWSATTKPSGAVVLFNANGVNAAKNVTATFSGAGNYVLTAVIFDGTYSVSSSVSVTVVQTTTSIVVAPSIATLHENTTQQFSATAYDQFGTALASQPTFTWTKTGVGSVSSSGLYSTSAAIGAATVQAASGSVSGTAAVTVINAAPTVATAAAAAQSVVTTQSTNLSVLGADDSGEANLTYTWSATVAPVGGTPVFSANGTNAAKASVVTFNKPGAYQLTATISDGSLTVTSTVAVSVVSTATTLTVTPATVSLAENATQIFSAVCYDQFSVAVVPQPVFTWSKASGIGTVSALGTYTSSGSAGSAVIAVSGGGLSTTAAVTVINSPPTIVIPATASASVVTGTATNLSVLAADDGGESNLTYTWSATTVPAGGGVSFSANSTNASKLSTATFSKAGAYTLTVAVSDGTNTITSSVSVTVVQTLTSISVTPSSASLNLNQSQQLSAAGSDQFGNVMSPEPTFLWTVVGGGSVTQAGLYTSASSPTPGTVYATSGGVSGSASMSVTNATPTVATAAAATPSSITGLTTTLSVLGADDGGESNLTYRWTAAAPSGATPVFSANGTNSAKNTVVTFNAAGSYTFTATITDAYGASVTSAVSVTVAQTLTTVTVSPAVKTLSIGASYQFAAAAQDQFGNAMATQPTFTWAVSIGGGSISSTGLYTAGGTIGSSSITATSGSVSGSASISTVNTATISETLNSAGTSVTLGVVGLSGGATLSWSVTAQPTGGSASFSSTTSSTPTLSFAVAGTYTVQLGITIAGVTTNVNTSFTVAQQLSSITVLPASTTVNENQSLNMSATGFDQFGLPMATQPAFTWSVTSGGGSIGSSTGVYTSTGSPGVASVRATSGGINGSATVTTVNAAPTVATPASAAPALVTGVSTALGVLGSDDGGEAALQYTWTVVSSPAGSAVTFSINGDNAAKNTTATFNCAGTYIFLTTISDGTNTVTSSTSATVVQTVSSIGINAAVGTVNEAASDQLTATSYDQFGNVMIVQQSVAWSESDSLGSVNSTGLFFAGTSTGNAYVRATIGGVFSTHEITVVHGAPTIAMAAEASPANVTGTSTGLSVLGSDANGESTLTYSWAITSSPIGAAPSFSINGTNAAKSTVVTFNEAGNYTFAVTISNGTSSITSSVAMTVSQTVTLISVSPATASMNLQSTQQFSASVLDQFGISMSSAVSRTWSVNSGVGSVNAAGLYSGGAQAGSADVRASAGGVEGDAAVTVSDAPPTIVSSAAAAPSTVTGTSTQLSALGNDDNGEANLTYTWAATAVPSGASPAFSLNDSNAAKNTTVYFNEAGSYTFAVSISDGTNSVVSTTSVTVVQTMASISVVPPTADVNVGSAQQLNAVAADQFGSPLATQPSFDWTLPGGEGSVTPGGLYMAGTSDGIATVQAQVGAITAASTVTVFGAPPAIVTAATASPSVVTGTTTELSMTASTTGNTPLDFSWAMISGPTGAAPQITPAATTNSGSQYADNAQALFNEPGDYEFQVTVSDGVESAVSSVAVTVDQTLSGLTVTAPSPTMNAYGNQQMSVAGYDQFGTAMAAPPVEWSIASGPGSITAGGEFIASSTTGSANIIAIAGAMTGIATVDVIGAAPIVTEAASAATTVVTGTSVALKVRAAEGVTGDQGLVYTWSQSSGPAGTITSFSANASRAAHNTTVSFDCAGDYVLAATITDATGNSVSSTVAVTVMQTLTAVTVTVPVSTTVGSASIQAAAETADQFGRDMDVSFAWSVAPGSVGTVNSSGLFTVGNVNGASTIVATSGAISGSAVVTSTATPTTIQVTPSYSSLYQSSGSGVLTAAISGDTSPNVIYTWSVVSEPTIKPPSKHKVGAAPSGQLVTFVNNNSDAAQSTPVSYGAPGDYHLKVVATDGMISASEEIDVFIEKAAVNPSLAVVAAVEPFIRPSDGLLGGFVITFSRAMNAASVTNMAAYRFTQSFQQPGATTWIQSLLGQNRGERTVTATRPIASVTYDPGSLTATVLLVTPLPEETATNWFQIVGTGKNAILDANGKKLDGDNNGKPGGSFNYGDTVHAGTYTHVYADGSVGTIKLFGPGVLLIVDLGNLAPLIYLNGCDPATSVLVGTVTNRPRKFTPKPIRFIVNASTAAVFLGDGFSVLG